MADDLNTLLKGNERFVSGKNEITRNVGQARRDELLAGQKPYAIVLCCSDSRVPPEIVFDEGMGRLFIVRVAGNTVDKVSLGSIEYGAEHLGCPLLVVLGHEKCGAVNATCAAVESGGAVEGNIAEIVRRITPAVEAAKKKGAARDKLADAAVDENVKLVISLLEKESAILKHLIHEKKLKVVGAKYHLGSGKVSILA